MGRGNAQAKLESERLLQRLCRLQNYRNLSSPFPPFSSPPQHATETTHIHMTDLGSWKKRTHQLLFWDIFSHCLIFQIIQTRFLHVLHVSNHEDPHYRLNMPKVTEGKGLAHSRPFPLEGWDEELSLETCLISRGNKTLLAILQQERRAAMWVSGPS